MSFVITLYQAIFNLYFGKFPNAASIAVNGIQLAEGFNWNDTSQLRSGIALTVGISNPLGLVAGGIALAAWAVYEYKRDH